MVRSEDFSNLVAIIVASDKQGVIEFLRSQGINVNSSADSTVVVKALYTALINSDVLRKDFISWANDRYQSNYGGGEYSNVNAYDTFEVNGVRYTQAEWEKYKRERASGKLENSFDGNFDPMSAQNGVDLDQDRFANASGGFDPMSAQSGVDLKQDRFVKASGGFDPMSAQSGVDLKQDRFVNATAYDSETGLGGTGFGNFLRGINIGDTVNSAVDIWKQSEVSKNQNNLINSQLKAKQLELDIALANGAITKDGYDAQLKIAQLNASAPKSSIVLWVVGGVVLLGALGTTIYFATRKR